MPLVPDCLIDLIGVEPCEGETTHLRDLTELEGLSIASIASTIPPEKWTSARDAIAALIPLAIDDTIVRVKAKMSAQGKQLLQYTDRGHFCYFGTQKQAGLTPGDGGVLIQKNTILQPAMQPIRVKWLVLKSPNLTQNFPVFIKDAAGNTLWDYTVPVLQPDVELEVQVGQDFYEQKIKIVVNGSDMQGYYAPCGLGEVCCGEPAFSHPYSADRSAFYVNAIEGGIVGGFKSPGITAFVELPCLDSLFCQYGTQLAPAFIYATGVRILKEWQASTRLNVFTIKKDWVKEKIDEWDWEVNNRIELVLPAILEDLMTCFPRCFKCKQPVGTLPAIP